MTKLLKYFLLSLLVSCSLASFSQTQGQLGNRFFSNWSIGVAGGPNVFFGDLKQTDFWPVSSNMNEWRFAGTFTLTKQFSHVFALRGQVSYGEIAGTKRKSSDGTPDHRYFEGNILDYNLNATINFSNFIGTYKPGRRFFVYGTLGAGVSTWITKTKDLDTHVLLDSSGSSWTPAFMILGGLGAYYNFGDKVNLGLEWNLHGVNSDYVDNTVFRFKYDAYSMVALTLTYNFNRRSPSKLQEARVEKQLGPMPARPEPEPEFPVQDDRITDPKQGKLPDLVVPLGFPVRDTLAPAIDTLLFSSDASNTSLLNLEEAGPAEPGLSYRVQVFAIETDTYSAEQIRQRYQLKQPVYKEFSEGWYRYTTGSFTSLAEAKKYLNEIRGLGIKTAFVARYDDGVRIPSHPKN